MVNEDVFIIGFRCYRSRGDVKNGPVMGQYRQWGIRRGVRRSQFGLKFPKWEQKLYNYISRFRVH